MARSWATVGSTGSAVLLALLLGGCGTGDDDAAASPSSSASPDAAVSSTPGADATPADYVPASLEGPAQNVPKPVLPELAKQESREGAQAFLDYWSDAMWYAYQTGDTSYAREIISPSCEVCLDQLDLLEEIYDSDSWAMGGRESMDIQDGVITRAADGIYKPVVLGSTEGAKLIKSNKVELNVPPNAGGHDPFVVYLDYKPHGWTYISAANLAGAEQVG